MKITKEKMEQIAKKQLQKYEDLKILTVPAKGAMEREKVVAKLVAKYTIKRLELKQLKRDPNLKPADRLKAMFELDALPKRSSRVRLRNRCVVTGHSRAYNRLTQLGRHAFRHYADKGLLPGITRVSW